MNPAYRHLEEPIRIGDFTLFQIAAFLICGMLACLWGFVLSPFGGFMSLATAVYLGGLPAVAVFVASTTDFDAWRFVRAFFRFQRIPGRFKSGPGEPRPSYVVHPKKDKRSASRHIEDRPLAVEELWSN